MQKLIIRDGGAGIGLPQVRSFEFRGIALAYAAWRIMKRSGFLRNFWCVERIQSAITGGRLLKELMICVT
jgi:hypothetical protein